MTETPRAYTLEETRNKFLDTVRNYAKYWATLENITNQERCDGVAFSILVLIDGCNVNMPSMSLAVCPHPDDKEYNESIGENYFEDGMVITVDSYLHDLYYQNTTAEKKEL